MRAAPSPAQLEFALPLDPRQLAELASPARGRRYRELGLDPEQREAVESAVRLVLAERYGTGR